MDNNKPLRIVVDYDGKNYDSHEDEFHDQNLKNIYGAAQKIFGMYRQKLNSAGAYIYVDANDSRPESFAVRGISAEMWKNILDSRSGNDFEV